MQFFFTFYPKIHLFNPKNKISLSNLVKITPIFLAAPCKHTYSITSWIKNDFQEMGEKIYNTLLICKL